MDYDYDYNDEQPRHISELDPNQVVLVEEPDGSFREATVAEMLEEEEAEEQLAMHIEQGDDAIEY